MVAVVSPVLHVPPQLPDRMTLSPSQNVVGPSGIKTEAVGIISRETTLLCISIAPAVVNPRPNKEDASNNVMAPAAIIVPRKVAPSPIVTAPLTCQYTLPREASLMSVTLANTAVESAPSIWKIKKAEGSHSATKTRSPLSTDAAPRQYMSGVRICPLPKVVPRT